MPASEMWHSELIKIALHVENDVPSPQSRELLLHIIRWPSRDKQNCISQLERLKLVRPATVQPPTFVPMSTISFPNRCTVPTQLRKTVVSVNRFRITPSLDTRSGVYSIRSKRGWEGNPKRASIANYTKSWYRLNFAVTDKWMSESPYFATTPYIYVPGLRSFGCFSIVFWRRTCFTAAWKIIKQMLPPKSHQIIKFVSKKDINNVIPAEGTLVRWGGKDTWTYKYRREDCEMPPSPFLGEQQIQQVSRQNANCTHVCFHALQTP